jgi:tetratricopeptide (TPR) repeat protein
VSELVVGTRNWPGIDATFRTRILIRAQNTLLFALTASMPPNNDIRRNLGIVYSEIGMVKMETEEFDLAASSFDAAEDMFTKIRRERPQDRRLLSDLVIVLQRKGELLIKSNKPKEAVAVLQKALRLSPGVENAVAEQSGIHTRLGIAYLGLDEHQKAKYHLEEANRQIESTIGDSSSWKDLRSLAASYIDLADILDPTTEGAEIEKHLQRVQALYSTIVNRSPDGTNDTKLIEIMMSAASISGKVHDKMGRIDEAIGAYRHALDIAVILVKTDPSNPRWMRKAATNADELAMFQINNGRREEAVPILKFSVALWRQLLERSQHDPELKLHVAVALLLLARASGGAPEVFAESKHLLDELVAGGAIGHDLAASLIDQYKSEFKIP